VNAQSLLGHYPVGAEAIRAATTPPPGHYTKLYNLFYSADDFKGPSGSSLDPNFEAFSYVAALRHFWITDIKIFGAEYGMDLTLLLIDNEVEFSTPNGFSSRSSTGFGDMLFQPLLLGWHGDNWDLGALYGIFLPTGDYDPADPSSPGKGFWTHMLGFGGTWYPDAGKTWSFSVMNRVEFHTENEDLDITPGTHYSMEWGLSKRLPHFWEIGAVGTINQKISDDTGSGVSYDSDIHDRVFSAGAEITKYFAKSKCQGSLRWFHEFEAEARPEGDAIWFSLMKAW
jgi:hypothetical protein